ncbi:hypothetical protein D4764_11G0000630 [Takifugu flavidus]|uniref:Uncharacterized protein n=1 Tax=Takifugu flavidus TaxID=433684 RepID=A0A5C6PDU7_9TELE|nr:hypothetical protein D4764_11G0000630 [Takifugu flavidus]
MVWYTNCRSCTDLFADLWLHPSLTHEQDPEIPELLHLRQNFSTNLEREAECDTPVVGTPPPIHFSGTVHDCHMMLQRHVSQDRPTKSRDLTYSGRISSTPEALPPRTLIITSVTSDWVTAESSSESPASPSSVEGTGEKV